MAHFDAVLPGRVHRVIYERMVEDTEAEVRRLLEYCGLPSRTRCLRFYENERAVRTASSEQVRQPIFRDARRALAPLRALARAARGRRSDRSSMPIPTRRRFDIGREATPECAELTAGGCDK